MKRLLHQTLHSKGNIKQYKAMVKHFIFVNGKINIVQMTHVPLERFKANPFKTEIIKSQPHNQTLKCVCQGGRIGEEVKGRNRTLMEMINHRWWYQCWKILRLHLKYEWLCEHGNLMKNFNPNDILQWFRTTTTKNMRPQIPKRQRNTKKKW